MGIHVYDSNRHTIRNKIMIVLHVYIDIDLQSILTTEFQRINYLGVNTCCLFYASILLEYL